MAVSAQLTNLPGNLLSKNKIQVAVYDEDTNNFRK